MQYAMAVVPVVGILFDKKAFNPAPNVNEVETVFDVPLEMFLKVPLQFDFYQLLFDIKFQKHFPVLTGFSLF